MCLVRGADLHMAQLMPLPLNAQIGFTFLVPAHLGSPGQRAVKRVCVCSIVLPLRAESPPKKPPLDTTSMSCRYRTCTMKSCCRQSLIITVINYQLTVQARRYRQLSWPTTVEFVTLWASTFVQLSNVDAVFKFQSLGQSSRGKYLYLCTKFR